MAAIPDFPTFDVSDLPSAGPRWKKYVSRFKILCVAMGLKDTDKAMKAALFQQYMGADCCDVYETLKADGDDYDAIKTKLSAYFVPKYNVDGFCTRLRRCGVTCDFDANKPDNELKLQLQAGCKSSRLRAKGVNPGVDLAKFLEIGKEMDLVKSRAERMEGSVTSAVANASGESVNAVRHSTSHRGTGNRGRSANEKKCVVNRHDATHKCNTCGGSFPHDGDCPAKNRKCYRCNTFGHYAKLCGKTKAGTSSGKPSRGRGKPVYNVRHCDVDSDSSEYSLAVHGSSGVLGSDVLG